MSGSPVSKHSRPRPVSARARLRPKSQLTLPEEVKRALRIKEGDEVEFRVEENGAITVRGYISVPTDHAWLYAEHHNPGQQPDRQLSEGQSTFHESADALFVHLDALGAADA
jgi:antitoxin PrlF